MSVPRIPTTVTPMLLASTPMVDSLVLATLDLLETVPHAPMSMSAQLCSITVTRMLAASTLLALSNVNAMLVSWAMVSNVKMLMNVVWESITVINLLSAKTNSVPSHADVDLDLPAS